MSKRCKFRFNTLLFRTVFAPRLDFACVISYSSCQALWISFADRRPTLALGILFVLPVLYLFAGVSTLSVFLTASLNNSLAHWTSCPSRLVTKTI